MQNSKTPSLILIIILLFISCFFRISQNTKEEKSVQETKQEIVQEIETQESSPEVIQTVTTFIDWVKAGKEELSKHTIYPLGRTYPIPPIKNKMEFLKRYGEVFDATLLEIIINSNPATDWGKVGWRGIMLGNGDLWITENGSLIAVNYQSQIEIDMEKELILADKKRIHENLREFERPVGVLRTKNHTIRIDNLGDNKYRYASWKNNKSMNNKPDLILTDGICNVDGSMGNHFYSFENGDYLYQCFIWMNDDKNPATLMIYKDVTRDERGCVVDGIEILKENAKWQ